MTAMSKTEILFIFVFLFSCCGSQEDEHCKCVAHYLCDKENRTVITTGVGIIVEKFGEICDCTCPGLNEVCCYLDKPKTNTSSSLSVPFTNTSDRATDNLPEIKPDLEKEKTQIGPCGIANPDGIGYKHGSEKEDVPFGEFPWMIGVLIKGNYRCGGSLIHPKVVLTAAHCVIKNTTYVARAGEWDSSDTKEILPHQDRDVALRKIHKNYRPGVYQNDIALLILERPFDLAKHIQLVCLPSFETVPEIADCYATGWGKNKFGGEGQYSAILRKILLPTLSHSKCEKSLKKTRLGEYFELDKSFVCAGGKEGLDTCVGDGGGPLMCVISDDEEERYQQVGITSWGLDCNEKDVPGVYANVAFLKPWIDKQMSELGLDTSGYRF